MTALGIVLLALGDVCWWYFLRAALTDSPEDRGWVEPHWRVLLALAGTLTLLAGSELIV